MSDMVERIADMLVDDHITLLRENERLRGEVERLTDERDAAVLRKVRYEIASGETRGEMAAHCREGDLYRIGDAILVWVNEGDIIALGQRLDATKEEKK